MQTCPRPTSILWRGMALPSTAFTFARSARPPGPSSSRGVITFAVECTAPRRVVSGWIWTRPRWLIFSKRPGMRRGLSGSGTTGCSFRIIRWVAGSIIFTDSARGIGSSLCVRVCVQAVLTSYREDLVFHLLQSELFSLLLIRCLNFVFLNFQPQYQLAFLL